LVANVRCLSAARHPGNGRKDPKIPEGGGGKKADENNGHSHKDR